MCSGCRVATYCSTTCSSADWEGHSYICGLIAYRERQVLARQAESLGARREAGRRVIGGEDSVAERCESKEIGMAQKKDDETCGEGKQAERSPAESQGPKKEAVQTVGKNSLADISESSENVVSLKNDVKKHFEEVDAMVNNNKIKDGSEKKDHPTDRLTSGKRGVKVKAPRVELKVERKVGETTKRLKMDVKVGTSVEKVIQNYAKKFQLDAADLQLHDPEKILKGTDVFVNTEKVIHIEVKEINNKK